ncbi:MAG TPA: amidohydrolase family protein, partial [Holophaga sp.]|nr:amidohydrolase family protein [Holophaga sp.]
MFRTIRIPWLHDRHSHVSFYASLSGCLSLADKSREDALADLRALPEDQLSMVFGWHSAKLPFTMDDLKPLPPAIIVNFSMHGFALSGEGERMLAQTQPEMAANWRDSSWSERNLPSLLETFSRTARITPDKLDLYMGRMEALGLGAVDDMLVSGDEAFEVIRRSAWGGHVLCWASPETFRSLSPASQEACAGLKFFTDGALGSRTAGLRGTFLDGQGGMLLHSDENLFGMLGEAHPSRKPLAIHAIGDGAIEQVLT